jgi:hypothetical protein
VVLAIDALQIAIGEEDIADAFVTGNSRLFTLVDAYG